MNRSLIAFNLDTACLKRQHHRQNWHSAYADFQFVFHVYGLLAFRIEQRNYRFNIAHEDMPLKPIGDGGIQ